MTKSMLIDASHPEETRVAVVEGNRIEELDFEIASKKQLRGNIYLAKVTRVEPSLQAAFIEYGGNRHGFLAFNEIHPDYFQIPHADREALMREAAAPGDGGNDSGGQDEPGDEDSDALEVTDRPRDEEDDIEAELDRRRKRMLRRYKIQEVIRRRQIMLVQVVKEERGNKGAALTTYLSLAGRYCVLMPNTARGGGISRKITNAADRKRLKSATGSLDVPTGMGLIVRTAGAARTKAEIKRDYEYLLRQWETIRETTLNSIAPALINSEEDLVKRAVRDMFDKDFDTVEVEGEAGWREARDFMRMLMPSQAKKVVHYQDATPLFVRHRVEDQIAQIHSPVVPLKSGGYLVINQTEALVAIDVNSGRATRERNIETTAYKTNMEAAAESARQLRLRDLAGLIVIDFIDMDESKNNRAVEKEMKDCLSEDRARVQMGKISQFGLMEISRQRRRMGVLEGATHVCEHCHGTGRIRSVESAAVAALRAVEMEASKGGAGAATLRLPTQVGLYVLNEKRDALARLEASHGLHVVVLFDDALHPGEQAIERTETREDGPRLVAAPAARYEPTPEDLADESREDDDDDEAHAVSEEREETRAPQHSESREEGEGARRGRRRRRGGRDRGDSAEVRPPAREGEEDDDATLDGQALEGQALDGQDGPPGPSADGDDEGHRRRRRRGRRGGRRPREEEGQDAYAWRHAHPHRPERDTPADAYTWREPHGEASEALADPAGGEAPEAGSVAPPTDAAPVAPAPGPQTPPPAGEQPYAWTEAEPGDAPPAPEEAPEEAAEQAKARRPRRPRKPKPDASAEAGVAHDVGAIDMGRVEVTAAAAVAEPEPAKADLAATPTPAAASEPVSSGPAAAPVAANESDPAPEPEPEPDPSEISAPPAEPRRGWWRRLTS